MKRSGSHSAHTWLPLQKLAECYTAAFTTDGWGNALGRCHDLGKASAEFQAKLHAANAQESENAGERDQAASQRVNHSTFGARYAHKHAGPVVGELLAYCIAGHHAGLPNAKVADDSTSHSTLQARLDPTQVTLPHVDDPGLVLPALTMHLRPSGPDTAFAFAFSRA